VIQQGQVFKLKAKGADGQPLWAYRYRLEGRASLRQQVGAFATRVEAEGFQNAGSFAPRPANDLSLASDLSVTCF
jgi:hypothetical protein